MLRFPYLLCLLLCIELSFCYSYIDEDAERKIHNLRRRNVRRENIRRVRRPNVQRSLVRQEEDYDRRPVEFDVASFIQPEEDNLEAEEVFMRHRSNKQRWSPKSFDLESMMKPVDSKREKTPDFMSLSDSLPELNASPPLSKDFMNAKHFGYDPMEYNSGKYGNEKYKNIYRDDLLMNQNRFHNQEKKCSLKAIKFPFFSHNKSVTLKPKKTKKRKLFFFNKSKKEVLSIPDFNKMNDETIIPYKYKIKRSYEQRLCPACKKIFVTTENDMTLKQRHERPKKHPKRSIHNTRQFFQNTIPDATLKVGIPDYGMNNELSNADNRYRSKRAERDRQLSILDEIQKKIDAVDIKIPHFEKPFVTKNNVMYN